MTMAGAAVGRAGGGSVGGRLQPPRLAGLAPHDRQRRIAIKCMELEEMLESQGHSQSEIEAKVASFRALLLRQVSNSSNLNNNKEKDNSAAITSTEETRDTKRSSNGEQVDGANGEEMSEKPRDGRKRKSHRDSKDDDDHEKSKKRHRHHSSGDHRRGRRRRRRRRSGKSGGKRKKRKRSCASPSYSDYEPENPLLRLRLKQQQSSSGVDTAVPNGTKDERRKKKRTRSRSYSRSRSRSRSSRRSRSRSPSGKRKLKPKDKKKKKKKRRHRYLPNAVPAATNRVANRAKVAAAGIAAASNSKPKKSHTENEITVVRAGTPVVNDRTRNGDEAMAIKENGVTRDQPKSAVVAAPANNGGKIYPKCLPRHALKAMASEAEAKENNGSENKFSYVELPAVSNSDSGVQRKRSEKLQDSDTRGQKSAAVGRNCNDADVINDDISPFNEDEHRIVFTKIEDIPTRPDSPGQASPWPPLPAEPPPEPKKFERNTFVVAETRNKKGDQTTSGGGVAGGGGGTTRLKFGLTAGSRRLLPGSGRPGSSGSTFAELSNKLGPLGHRKNSLRQQQPENKPAVVPFVSATEVLASTTSGRLPPLREHIRQIEEAVAAEVASTAAAVAAAAAAGSLGGGRADAKEEADAATDVVDMELEESFVESTAKRSTSPQNDKSRSRSWDGESRSRSRSRGRRSRSRSYHSYSRSRSRSRGSYYSRSSRSSRSRSYSSSSSASSYSSRSRSRSRSPSIQRRRGSPSFLDKRRITSARKRPIPYHRPSPSPTPSESSWTSRSSSRSSRSSWSRSWSRGSASP